MARPGANRWILGPVVADPEDLNGALAMATHLVQDLPRETVRVYVPDVHPLARRLPEALGPSPMQGATRMSIGAEIRESGIWAEAGPETG